jgi:RHS repeat-associated protein
VAIAQSAPATTTYQGFALSCAPDRANRVACSSSWITASGVATLEDEFANDEFYIGVEDLGNANQNNPHAGLLEMTVNSIINNNPLSYADAGGHAWQMTWDSRRNLLNLTDPLSNRQRFNWTTTDDGTTYISLLANSTDYRGNKWEFTYDANGNLNRTTDPYTNYTERHYDSYGFQTYFRDFRGNITSWSYDSHGYALNMTDATANITFYGRDFVGRMVNMTTPLGYLWNYTYDALDRLVNATDPLLNSTFYTYDARGGIVSVRDARGQYANSSQNVTNGKVANMTNALGEMSTNDYDLVGNVVAVTDRLGHQTSYTYDGWNRVTKVTDPGGNETKYAYNADGTMHNKTDRRGYTWTYGYDAKHRLVNVTDPLGNYALYGHDADNHGVNLTNARGYKWSYTYDALGHLVTTTDPYGNSTNRSYDQNGNLANLTDSNDFSTTFGYDALNRRTITTNSLGLATNESYSKDSRVSSFQDQGGNFTNSSFDQLDRLTQTIDAMSNTSNLTYDAVGKVLNVTDASGHVTNRTYDSLNRLTQEQSPLGYNTNYTYDAHDRLITRQDAKDQFTNYTYDQNNRLIQVDLPDAVQLLFRYDAEGNRIDASGYGFSRNDTYDALGRVVSIRFNYATFQKTVNYSYDAAGNRLSMQYDDGKWLNYTYDALNRVISEKYETDSPWTFTYDAASRLVQIGYPSGMTTEYQYNGANWITAYYTNTSSHLVIDSAAYAYDLQGNRLSFTDNRNQKTEYSYNKRYRLLTEQDEANNPSTKTTYTYDGVGNRLSQKTGSAPQIDYSYDAENRMTARGSTSYSYDLNGNLIQVGATPPWTLYEWDAENHLTKVTLPNGTAVSYEYTTEGQRISWRQGLGPKTWYGYDFKGTGGYDDLIAEYSDAGTMVVRYVHGPGLDQPLARMLEGSGTTYHYTFDALGSVTRMMTTTQIENAKYRYKAFGGARETTEGAINPYRFTARELDTVSGLFDYRARYYDTGTGRFFGQDPIGLQGGPNLYAYVGANPVMRVDPSGLRRMDDNAGSRSGSDPGPVWVTIPITMGGKCTDEWCKSPNKSEINVVVKTPAFMGFSNPGGDCGADVKKEIERLYPDTSKIGDKFRHCMWGCLAVRYCGGFVTKSSACQTAKDWEFWTLFSDIFVIRTHPDPKARQADNARDIEATCDGANRGSDFSVSCNGVKRAVSCENFCIGYYGWYYEDYGMPSLYRCSRPTR